MIFDNRLQQFAEENLKLFLYSLACVPKIFARIDLDRLPSCHQTHYAHNENNIFRLKFCK